MREHFENEYLNFEKKKYIKKVKKNDKNNHFVKVTNISDKSLCKTVRSFNVRLFIWNICAGKRAEGRSPFLWNENII